MPKMSTLKILVVEDEILVATDIEEALISLDYEVQNCVATGKAAIEEVERSLPDLILMDIMLKGEMTGIEAAQEITKKHDVPIIYLTANADIATIEKAKISLPYGYIIKPFTERDLQTNIEIARFKFENDMKAKVESDQFREFFKPEDHASNKLMVESGTGLKKIDPSEVYFIEKNEEGAIIHLFDDQIEVKRSPEALAGKFSNHSFVRINTDFIVNAKKVFIKKYPEIIIADKMTVLHVDNDKQQALDDQSAKK
jgi:two-component system, LytTR family, response regulator LytT